MAEAKGEIGYGSGFVEWFSQEARRSYGDFIPSSNASKRIITMRQPVGVAGLITPVSIENNFYVMVAVQDLRYLFIETIKEQL